MRYKGIKIPTYEEAIDEMKLNKTYDGINLLVDARDVNIKVCTIDEAEKIKEMDGINGINKKIEDAVKDYVDHYMTTAIAAIDGVKEMETTVQDDPNKTFKNMYLNNKDVPTVDTTPDDIEEDNTTLTDEQIDQIVEATEKVVENNENLKTIRDLPSNNGVDERAPEDITETGESKVMNVSVDPNTGEQKILGEPDSDYITDTFEDLCDKITNSDIEFGSEDQTITEEDEEYITRNPQLFLDSSIVSSKELRDIPVEAVHTLITLANRRIAKENFSVYNAMPKEVKTMIDKYALEAGIPITNRRYMEIKHSVAEMLLDEFVSNISMEKIKKDFNKEIETMFSKASNEIGEEIIGYSDAKIKKYREAAEIMEDPEKKEKLLNVLARIEEAYDLNELKEFAKKCKIKKFDLEKPAKYYDAYNRKYAESNYNIYSIELARPILYRNLNTTDTEEYRDIDINAFFIAFCKQTQNMKPGNVLDHAYMYYVIYNIVLADLNKSEKTRHVSEEFLNNVKEVIANLRSRNQSVL